MTLHETIPRTWPTPPRLPGQADAPEGPIDLTMTYALHHAFRRDLRAFAAAAEDTPITDRVTWQALATRLDLFASAMRHHNRGEDDGVWPLLIDRADDCDGIALAAMESERHDIEPMLDACATAFRTLALTADESVRADLAATLHAAVDSVGQHLAHEETEAIPLIQRYITPAEWARIDREFFQGMPTALMIGLVPWIMHELPIGTQARLVADYPRPLRAIWRLTRGGFARRERIAFRYLNDGSTGIVTRIFP